MKYERKWKYAAWFPKKQTTIDSYLIRHLFDFWYMVWFPHNSSSYLRPFLPVYNNNGIVYACKAISAWWWNIYLLFVGCGLRKLSSISKIIRLKIIQTTQKPSSPPQIIWKSYSINQNRPNEYRKTLRPEPRESIILSNQRVFNKFKTNTWSRDMKIGRICSLHTSPIQSNPIRSNSKPIRTGSPRIRNSHFITQHTNATMMEHIYPINKMKKRNTEGKRKRQGVPD